MDSEVKIVALKIIWINKLVANDFHAWKVIPNFLWEKEKRHFNEWFSR